MIDKENTEKTILAATRTEYRVRGPAIKKPWIKNTNKNKQKKYERGKYKIKTEGKNKEKEYRLVTNKLFLTYPQCPIKIDTFKKEILSTLFQYKVTDFLLVREEHEDKTKHIHAYVEIRKRLDTKNPKFLDITDKDDENQKKYHGNYLPAKSTKDVVEYMTKDIFKEEDVEENLRASQGMLERLGTYYELKEEERILIEFAEKGKVETAMNKLREINPKKYLDKGSQIQKRLQDIYLSNLASGSRYNFESFTILPRLKDALRLYEGYKNVKETKVLFIEGIAGCGKTEFALAYLEQKLKLRVLIVHDREDLKFFNSTNYNAILFDDPDFSKLSREQLINIMDNHTRIVRIRYNHTIIGENVLKIITSNKPPEQVNFFFQDPALKRRIIEYKQPDKYNMFNKQKTEKLLIKKEDKERFKNKLILDSYQKNYYEKNKALPSEENEQISTEEYFKERDKVIEEIKEKQQKEEIQADMLIATAKTEKEAEKMEKVEISAKELYQKLFPNRLELTGNKLGTEEQQIREYEEYLATKNKNPAGNPTQEEIENYYKKKREIIEESNKKETQEKHNSHNSHNSAVESVEEQKPKYVEEYERIDLNNKKIVIIRHGVVLEKNYKITQRGDRTYPFRLTNEAAAGTALATFSYFDIGGFQHIPEQIIKDSKLLENYEQYESPHNNRLYWRHRTDQVNIDLMQEYLKTNPRKQEYNLEGALKALQIMYNVKALKNPIIPKGILVLHPITGVNEYQ